MLSSDAAALRGALNLSRGMAHGGATQIARARGDICRGVSRFYDRSWTWMRAQRLPFARSLSRLLLWVQSKRTNLLAHLQRWLVFCDNDAVRRAHFLQDGTSSSNAY